MANTLFNGTLKTPTDLVRLYIADRAAIDANTAWSEEFYTLKASLNVDQAQGSKTETFVDQTNVPIAVSYGTGTFGFTCRIPDVSKEVVNLFYDVVTVAGGATIEDGFTATGFSGQIVAKTKMAKLIYKDWGIVFPHIEMVAVFKKTGAESWTLDVTGTVLAGDGDGEAADFIILEK